MRRRTQPPTISISRTSQHSEESSEPPADLSSSCGAEGQTHLVPEMGVGRRRKLSAPNLLLHDLHAAELLQEDTEFAPKTASTIPTKRVLVLYIGGTIGMARGPTGWVPQKGLLTTLLHGNGKFHDPDEPIGHMPVSQWGRRVVWTLQERDVLLDSSDMDQTDWIYVAEQIKIHYDSYDGFVLIQGTDTLTYTASALSFMCRFLAKTVIVTGSQVPMVLQPNDAESNLFASISIAGHFEIPEVCVFFNGKLMRGNRTSKFDASGFDAFVSQNYPALLQWGPEIKVKWNAVRTSADVEFLSHPFSIVTRMSTDVAVLRLFPGISASFLRGALQPPLKGCVLMTYGAGNVSLRANHVIQCLKEATMRGVLIINITQCNRGTVTAAYATGHALLDAGVQPGHDMTCEAAVCKLSFLLGLVDSGEYTLEQARSELPIPARGECSVPSQIKSFSFRDGSFVAAFVNTLEKLLLPEDRALEDSVSTALFPVLLCSAASQGDLHSLEAMLQLTDASSRDYDGRTALHLAAKAGKMNCISFLVERAHIDVNVIDSDGRTPLDLAAGSNEVVTYLRLHGAKAGSEVDPRNDEGY